MIGVGSVPENQGRHLVVLYKGHYFIGTDNGLFSLIMEDEKSTIVELTDDKNSTFPMFDVFLKPAIALASGKPMSSLGKTRDGIMRSLLAKPSYDSNMLTGSIVYMDSFENAITNIHQDLFNDICKGRDFTIYMRKFDYNITKIKIGRAHV